MANLSNQQINSSFSGILQVPGGITSTLQSVQDGNGNTTGLQISSTAINGATANNFVASVNGTAITGAVSRPISDGFGDYVNVKDFGATGNGSTDDTTAVLNAISTGKNILFPIGTYKVTQALTLSSGQQLEGLSKYWSQILFIGDINGIIMSTYCEIKNIRIIGTSTMSSNKACVEFGSSVPAYRSKISNCIIGGLNTSLGDSSNVKCGGASILGGSGSFLGIFENLYVFYSNVGFDNPQTGSQTNNALLFAGCEFKSCTIGARIVTLNGVEFNQCTFEGNDENGLIIGDSRAANLTACYFESNNQQNTSPVKCDLYIGLANNMSGFGTQPGKGITLKDTYFAAGTYSIYGVYVEGHSGVVVDSAFFSGYSTNYSVYVSANPYDNGSISNVYVASAAPVTLNGAPFTLSNNTWTGSSYTAKIYATNGFITNGNITWTSGSGTPEGAVTAPIGSLYSRDNGGAGTSLYVKESGTGNTGWVGK